MLARFRLAPALCALMVASQMLWLLAPAAHAGEFGATFNSRLACERSSWYEGKVASVNGGRLTVAHVRDLLRHAPKRTLWVPWSPRANLKLRKGDLVLINYQERRGIVDVFLRRKRPNSYLPGPPGPSLIGKIDPRSKRVDASDGFCYASAMVTWFYRTDRWDARVITQPGSGRHGIAWYAKLPNGKQYLIYDEGDRKRPSQFPTP